jgi:cytochrome c peroxidase
LTYLPQDRALFKVPSLRNIALTAPYMHNGSIKTLNEVIDHYASGGLPHENKSSLLKGFVITDQQKAQLIAFLQTLTDTQFINYAAYRE